MEIPFESMSEIMKPKGYLILAIGTGVVIGAAGTYLWQQIDEEKRKRLLLTRDIVKLDGSVSQLRKELDIIRDETNKLRRRRVRRNTTTTTTVAPSMLSETEMFSTLESTIGDETDDLYYDVSSDENTFEMEGNKETVQDSPVFNSEEFYAEVDKLYEGSIQDKTKSFGLLLEIEEKFKERSEDAELLWRLARAYYSMSSTHGSRGDKQKKKECVMKGISYAEKALGINSESSNVHKWYAICVGERGQFLPTKEKISDGFTFKKHVEEAVRLNPKDPILHHLLGRFFYEIAQLTWLERSVANTLFGPVPEGSYPDAIKCLLQSETMNETPYKDNRLLLAKCFIQSKKYEEAAGWLKKAADVEIKSDADSIAQKEIESLMKTYKKYL